MNALTQEKEGVGEVDLKPEFSEGDTQPEN